MPPPYFPKRLLYGLKSILIASVKCIAVPDLVSEICSGNFPRPSFFTLGERSGEDRAGRRRIVVIRISKLFDRQMFDGSRCARFIATQEAVAIGLLIKLFAVFSVVTPLHSPSASIRTSSGDVPIRF